MRTAVSMSRATRVKKDCASRAESKAPTAAAASWFLVEKPALRLKARLPGAVNLVPGRVEQPV